MTVLSRILPIPLPVDVAWDTLVDLNRWAHWMPHVAESGWSADDELAPGRRLWFRLQHNERQPLVIAEVTALRPNREFTYRPVGGESPYVEGMEDLEWQWLLHDRPTGCSVRLSVSYSARGGMPMLREMIGARLQILNQADNVLLALLNLAGGEGASSVHAEA